jgi:hypothetical protein
MTARWAGVLLAVLISSPSAIACRCAELELADYFDQADRVLAAAIEAVDSDADEQGQYHQVRYRVMGPPWKGGQSAGESDRFLTATSSAACGLDPAAGEVWILFLSDSEDALANRCDGSRRLADPAAMQQGVGDDVLFKDIPHRFVAAQLNALAGLDDLRQLSDANAPRLQGLLDIESLTHGGQPPIHRSEAADSEVIAVIDRLDQLQTREAGYEFPAATVYARTDVAYQLRLADGRAGWMRNEHAGTWFPYPKLLIDRLAYMTSAWSGFLWPDPGAGLPLRLAGAATQRPARVTDIETLGGAGWIRVEILTTNGCDGQVPAVVASGWTPAWHPGGEPTVWFYSRGC